MTAGLRSTSTRHRPGEGSLKENMDNYKKYIVGTLKATLNA
jgi:hypothetical protein